jgi:hypothetical protein
MPVEQAPFWQKLLLEQPLPLVVALGVGGLVILWAGFQRRQRRVMLTGAVAVGLAAGLWLVALVVATPREQVHERTRLLLERAAPTGEPAEVDIDALRQLFTSGAVLLHPTRGHGIPVTELLDAAARFGTLSRIDRHRLSAFSGGLRPDGQVSSVIDVTSFGGQVGVPRPTRWRLTWRLGDDGAWRISRVEWLDHPHGLSPNPAVLP